jgi:hypothetical protein
MAKGKKTGGRVAGTPNKATQDIKAAARIHGPNALKVLSSLMLSAESEQARIAAAKEILDRAYGKATQPVGEDPTMPFVSKEQRDAAVRAAYQADT